LRLWPDLSRQPILGLTAEASWRTCRYGLSAVCGIVRGRERAMTDGFFPAAYGSDARAVGLGDFGEIGTQAPLDGDAHAAGKTCASCGEAILGFQAARLVRESDWIHDGCHRPRSLNDS